MKDNNMAADCVAAPRVARSSATQDNRVPSFPGRISNTHGISILRNDRECKCIFYVS